MVSLSVYVLWLVYDECIWLFYIIFDDVM